MCVCVGGETRERYRLVPQSPRLRLLALRYRRVYTDVEPELPRTVRSHRHRPGEDHLRRQGVPRRLPHLSQGNLASRSMSLLTCPDFGKALREIVV